MDTTVLEYTAEDLIAHRLQRAGILVAKPKFDREGTDLIGLIGVSDGAKFCRIQCKGRSVANSPSAHVEIRTGYATDGFVVFLYVETGVSTETHLYCFTGKDIRSWRNDGANYCLNISRSNFSAELAPFAFTDERAALVKRLIVNIGISGEFNRALYGYIQTTLEGASASFTGTNTGPESGSRRKPNT